MSAGAPGKTATIHPGRVSVIVPSHSHVSYLPEAVAAAARQDYEDVEIVVVDDGSDQNVEAALRSIAVERPIRYVRQERAGAAAARNTGRVHATGEFLAFLDEDDYWEPAKTSAGVAVMAQDAHVGVVFSDGYVVGRDGARLDRFQARKAFAPTQSDVIIFQSRTLPLAVLLKGIVVTSSTLVRTTVFDAIGGFAALPAGQDVDFFYRAHQISRFAYISRPLFFYRLTDNSISRSGVTTLRHSLVTFQHFATYPLAPEDRRALRAQAASVERQLGERLFETGNHREARLHLARSIVSGRSWNPRTALFFCASFLPRSAVAAAKAVKRWLGARRRLR
jgi:glycosyltransferase involved in cell wall biosynthesis